jgi:hypothetical protein
LEFVDGGIDRHAHGLSLGLFGAVHNKTVGSKGPGNEQGDNGDNDKEFDERKRAGTASRAGVEGVFHGFVKDSGWIWGNFRDDKAEYPVGLEKTMDLLCKYRVGHSLSPQRPEEMEGQ